MAEDTHRRRRIYRQIDEVPMIFGLPAQLFLMVITPLMVFVFMFGLAGGIYISIGCVLIVLAVYVLLLRVVERRGHYFFALLLHSLKNRFWIVNRTKKGALPEKKEADK